MRKIIFGLIFTLIVLTSISAICAADVSNMTIDESDFEPSVCESQNIEPAIGDDEGMDIDKDCADAAGDAVQDECEVIVDKSLDNDSVIVVDSGDVAGDLQALPSCVSVYASSPIINNLRIPSPYIYGPVIPDFLYTHSKKVSCHLEKISHNIQYYDNWLEGHGHRADIKMRVVDDSGRGVANYPVVACVYQVNCGIRIKFDLDYYNIKRLLYTDGDGYVTFSYILSKFPKENFGCMFVNEFDFDKGYFWIDRSCCWE